MNPVVFPIFAAPMRKFIFPLLLITVIFSALGLSGCDPYKKLAKSSVIADKDSAAVHYYNAKKYDQAVYIFEELMAVYRGTPRMEEMYYYYAYSRYFLGELVTAAFYFDDFAQKFPMSKHADEFEFMTAKCYYQISDPYYLDQTYTDKAISQMQLFLSRNPNSEHKEKCMAILTELRERLAKKAFEQALLYQKIGYYKAAVESFKNLTAEFSDSKFREESQFLLVKSSVDLAESSIATKKLQRFEEAAEFYEKFVEKFPNSKFGKDAENLKSQIDKSREKLEAEERLKEENLAFDNFRKSMRIVMDTDDAEVRNAEYTKALAAYRTFQETYPKSERLAEADKLFKQFEKKYEE